MLELEHHLELVAARVAEEPRLVEGDPRRLPHPHRGRVAAREDLVAQLRQELVQPRPVEVVRRAVAQRVDQRVDQRAAR